MFSFQLYMATSVVELTIVSVTLFLLQIVEQLEDGTVQILDQSVEMINGKIQYVTNDQVVVQEEQLS